MNPTFKSGEFIIVSKYFKLQNSKVVVVRLENRDVIKRVTAIKNDEIFIEGDNSSASTDSRTFGWINKSNIIGSVIWPKTI